MNDHDLLARLRDLDPVRSGPAQTSDAGSEQELAAILAHPVDRPVGGRLRRNLRRHGARVVALLLALVIVGGGVAYAAGLPDDVRRVFAGIAAEPAPAGQPVPWGDNPARLVTSLPLGDGRTVQQWESDNDLNGTCTYTRVVDPTGNAEDVGHGCQGVSPVGAPAGVEPTLEPGVHVSHQAVEVTAVRPDLPAGPSADTIDVPTWYLMEIYAPGVGSIELVTPGHPAVVATIRGHWAVVRSPVDTGQDFSSAPSALRLLDARGRLRWTFDLDTWTTTPGSLYRAYEVAVAGPTDPAR